MHGFPELSAWLDGSHASASLSYSHRFSAHCVRLRRRETRRATRLACRRRTQSRRNGTRADLARHHCELPDSAAPRARCAASFANRCSPPRRHSDAARVHGLRRTPTRRRARASRGRSPHPCMRRYAQRSASVGAGEIHAHATRKPRRRLWTRRVGKSCGAQGSGLSGRFGVQQMALSAECFSTHWLAVWAARS
jgi:hypothetical protein